MEEEEAKRDLAIPIPRERTISKGGLRANFWNYVEKVTGQRSLKKFIWQGSVMTLLSWLPTIWGSVIRGLAYKKVLGSVGSNCLIGKNVHFRVPEKIFLGDRVFIGDNACLDAAFFKSEIRLGNDVHIEEGCYIKAGIGNVVIHEGVRIHRFSLLAGYGGVEIGKNSLLANNVELLSSDHIFDDPTIPIRFQGTRMGRIVIGEDVWLGAYVIVLPGVKISNGSVVGAGSVVTKSIPGYSVAVGNPARVLKKRRPHQSKYPRNQK